MDDHQIQAIAKRIGDLWIRQQPTLQQQQHGQPQRSHVVPSSTSRHLTSFRQAMESCVALVRGYEDWDLQEKARAVMPVDRFHANARKALESEAILGFEDLVVKELLRWFKHEFFRWVDQPPCDRCQSATKGIGAAPATLQEQQHGGFRVELYRCTKCQALTRFPRYNDPAKLLETRRGRCGEWANVFTLCCRALGFETRYVHDWTDHVWTEVYSERLQKWVHLDSCEEAFDTPMVYEGGWGKQLTYIVAFSTDEVVDVIQRYTRKLSQVSSRRSLVPEDWLKGEIVRINQSISRNFSPQKKQQIADRAMEEAKELMENSRRALQAAEMQERQSGTSWREISRSFDVVEFVGSKEWRTQRGEAGAGASAVVSLPLELPPNMITKITRQNHHAFCQVNGSATIPEGNRIQLTPAENGCTGSAWFPIHLSASFLVEFGFRVRKGGADGFAFVLQNDINGMKTLGKGGSDLGYTGIRNSLAIEFDCYDSGEAFGDPNGNHISIHVNPEGGPNSAHHKFSIACSTHLPQLNDGSLYYCVVVYRAQRLEVWLTDKKKDLAVVGDAWMIGENYLKVLETDANVDLGKLTNCEPSASLQFGFTAATGGLNECHEVFDVTWWSSE